MISEFTHVMFKVCVKLAALSAEWPGRRKTYGPGEFMFNYSIRANLTFPRFHLQYTITALRSTVFKTID